MAGEENTLSGGLIPYMMPSFEVKPGMFHGHDSHMPHSTFYPSNDSPVDNLEDTSSPNATYSSLVLISAPSYSKTALPTPATTAPTSALSFHGSVCPCIWPWYPWPSSYPFISVINPPA
jgi:hypothetical protein